MGLNLRIENEPSLPDGGPLTYSLTGNRGADIGRDAHLDWTLPDASRHVSGKHCEIRYQDGGYLLYDVSRNGTFLNGSDRRVQSPHRLRTGDRLMIGHYIVGVEVTGENTSPAPDLPQAPLSDPEDLWAVPVGAAPPIDPRELRPQGPAVPVRPDFLEWAIDVPGAPGVGFVARPVAVPEALPRLDKPRPMDWDAGDLAPPPSPEPPAPVPTPRRSVWVSPGPSGPWGGEEDTPASPAAAPHAPSRALPAGPPASAPGAEAAWGRPANREPAVAPSSPAPVAAPAAPSDLIGRFTRGAGLPAGTLSPRDAGEFGEYLGRVMLIVADNVKQLLDARSQTKRIARSSSQTMIAALDNNPLKFSPTGSDALRTMLNPSTGSYLDADRALRQSFDDLKSHQVKTFSAMQRALAMLLEDMDPQSIETSLGADKGLSAWFGLRRSRLWTLYESRWKARTQRHGGGMQDLFMQYFAECYDRAADTADDRGRSNKI